MLTGGSEPSSPSTKAVPVEIAPEASAGEAIQVAIDACLDHLAPNEACWLETEHADCLHQTRVSTRRLRALFSLSRRLVRSDPVAMDLKVRMRRTLLPLGPARDLDVTLVRAREEQWSAADIGRLERARAEASAVVRETLSGATWKELWSDLARWRSAQDWLDHVAELRDGPARAVTDNALDRRYRRIVLAGPSLLAMPEPELHRIRIEGKKLRYGCQFFDGLYPDAGTVVVSRNGEGGTVGERETDGEGETVGDGATVGEEGGVGEVVSVPLHLADVTAQMQDAFGAFNDYAVARGLRERLSLESGAETAPPSREECLRAWERVAATPPFWRLS